MTLETARAILGITSAHHTRRRLLTHTIAESTAFEARLVRLRPRSFVRLSLTLDTLRVSGRAH